MEELVKYIGKGDYTDIVESMKAVYKSGTPSAYVWASLAMGVLLCFFGLKLTRVLSVIVGLILGTIVGLAVGGFFNVSGIYFIVIIVVCALVIAFCSGFFYRVGVFFVSFLYCVSIGMAFFSETKAGVIAVLIVSLVIAILSAIFAEPLVIILTSLAGGVRAGRHLILVVGIAEPPWAGLLAGAVFSVVGMIIQFMMHSGKVSRKERMRSEEIKSRESVEIEVDQARSLLNDDE